MPALPFRHLACWNCCMIRSSSNSASSRHGASTALARNGACLVAEQDQSWSDERPKKEDDAPSTAIDIDSSIKRRRPKPPAYQAATEAAVRREQEMRQREQERFMRPPMEEPAVEQPAFQRVPDMVPIEDGIDPDYPAQRIVISNFVRNGCHIKRWLYEDSYPLDAPRPSIYGLTGKGRQYPNCCCGRRGLCYGCCGRGSTSKQRGYIQDNYENDRIRGELQRLDVILKNLDD
ncbi:unnamed protein product [Cylicocyclus nassatus]|uniref:Uncharacterized protein n=1 Tax=Cylicocyclus nassatus TaxID=53992 RepID=A0AA36H492_CYLNA|nr:unnamed protein product [Cylicocyclus nassatus]